MSTLIHRSHNITAVLVSRTNIGAVPGYRLRIRRIKSPFISHTGTLPSRELRNRVTPRRTNTQADKDQMATTAASTHRTASHAGSWYSDDEAELSSTLDKWLDMVTDVTECIGPISSAAGASSTVEVPSAGARVIIAPHAGYYYSGRAAAWAYKSLDLSNVKRVFILGPSHHFRLRKCALSQCDTYETPLGHLRLDLATTKELHRTGQFDKMSLKVDEAEHSIEMHLPYVYKMLQRTQPDQRGQLPPIVPVLVGDTTNKEREYGQIFAPYVADPSNVFVISSDFCHWGPRHFGYSYYENHKGEVSELHPGQTAPSNPTIHENIYNLDMRSIKAVESGEYDAFIDELRKTDNTVCGRHPIGVIMAALEHLRRQKGQASYGKFKFIRYERSKTQTRIDDSSVSYASAFAVV